LIKDKLAEAGYGYLQLQPIIVTPLSRDEVVADFATAGDHGIAVVCKGDLEVMLSQVGLLPNPNRVFQDSKRLVPRFWAITLSTSCQISKMGTLQAQPFEPRRGETVTTVDG
jgi:hypothetical protein